MLSITAIIPARSGSKRLKNKNIYPVWEKPMMYWAINACKNSIYNIDVWVSTDSDLYANIAKECGAKIVYRDEIISNDTAFKQEAIRDAAKKIDNIKGVSDFYISLQANSPQIKSYHLDAGIKKIIDLKKDEIISVNDDLCQNGAFRIFRENYVYQKDLSTNCGVIVYNLSDIHTIEDILSL